MSDDFDYGLLNERNSKMPMRYKMGAVVAALFVLSTIATIAALLLRKNNTSENDPISLKNFTVGEVAVAIKIINDTSLSVFGEVYTQVSCAIAQQNWTITNITDNKLLRDLMTSVAFFQLFNFKNCSNTSTDLMILDDKGLCAELYQESIDPGNALYGKVIGACSSIQKACANVGNTLSVMLWSNHTDLKSLPRPIPFTVDTSVKVGCNLTK